MARMVFSSKSNVQIEALQDRIAEMGLKAWLKFINEWPNNPAYTGMHYELTVPNIDPRMARKLARDFSKKEDRIGIPGKVTVKKGKGK